VWLGFNLLLAVGILVALGLGHPPPSLPLYVSEADRLAMPASVGALIHALAVLLNAITAGFCLLALAVTWMALRQGARWARWVMPLAFTLIQLFGYVSDASLGSHNLVPNLLSTVLLGVGFFFALRASPTPTRP
jgi:hypothetical protein